MIDYHGYPVRTLQNAFLRVDVLETAGPRIVGFGPAGSSLNLMAEVPDITADTPYGVYHFLGGHRLWHSPEVMPRTYVPDDTGLVVEETSTGVRLIQPVEGPTGLRKTVELSLDAGRAAMTVDHYLENTGMWTVECAPWAITQLIQGGIALMPQRDPQAAWGFLPDRKLSIWPYTRLNDPRLHLDDDVILIEAQPALPPCKVGTFNPLGWIGYLFQDVFFCKRFEPQFGRLHPDFDNNSEIYCNNRFIELETIGPLAQIQPGQTIALREVWELTTGLDFPATAEGARQLRQALAL